MDQSDQRGMVVGIMSRGRRKRRTKNVHRGGMILVVCLVFVWYRVQNVGGEVRMMWWLCCGSLGRRGVRRSWDGLCWKMQGQQMQNHNNLVRGPCSVLQMPPRASPASRMSPVCAVVDALGLGANSLGRIDSRSQNYKTGQIEPLERPTHHGDSPGMRTLVCC